MCSLVLLFAGESPLLPCVPRQHAYWSDGVTLNIRCFSVRLRDDQYTDAIQYTDSVLS